MRLQVALRVPWLFGLRADQLEETQKTLQEIKNEMQQVGMHGPK